ncbi:hypothetical protein [Streptomyces sp. H27-D2]|uniref:hypothetical protein n=1 Tax=Streptomyces sp. H27-D2 TaxID=3046304 RepID=UPI002DBC3E81|nr:hypothetical protein [Streptomyces sp. H27-D2]MEC4015105.1 hypothetical protein [Streptomyces sp. H27-D2]
MNDVRPNNAPALCIKCKGTALILSKALHPDRGESQWRLTCLDCRVAWPQDQHGGDADEYL